MQFRKYTEQEFKLAVANSRSMRQALSHLNVAPYGGNYDTARKYIKRLGLDTSHWKKQAWMKGITPDYLIKPLDDYLSGKIKINSHKLKLRLLRDNVFPHRCMNCKLTAWLGLPIPLELHHIDGNNHNPSKENLQLLCPNCHALTNNYRGKNK
jgi:hypothetical protein